MRESMRTRELLSVGAGACTGLREGQRHRARMTISHRRAYDFDEKTGLYMYKEVDDPETVSNMIIDAGRRFAHQQLYGSSGLGANGFNYIALSNTVLTETAESTVLDGELTIFGLSRAQGTVTLPTGAMVNTTIAKLFTATGGVSARKAALFTAASGGTMNHVIAFTPRSLAATDTLQVNYNISLE